eukprot:CAMPEP_0114627786 /NCGR_PEP_ID=MMETSP0168-20121206/12479_1 /TAXON_ID=95228 ORGANISM="Vannella sp., Strain DIVA3 517/6/12" /NCGR_SAMPLE_ID=MMETSP0168 /ASSEMBLY_ACC=CAM_ASM_000044 /LENGTH=109 /DNA_ID=CAMNT_0001839137 /DNA_START=11 /DNA_END=337 /DNA_ORIENTATION=+
MAATVVLSDSDAVQRLLKEEGIDGVSLSLAATVPLLSSSTCLPVRAAARLGIPVGVMLDGDAWKPARKSDAARAQWKALGENEESLQEGPQGGDIAQLLATHPRGGRQR